LAVAEKRLNAVAPEALKWWVDFPVGREYALGIWWQEPANNDEDGEWQHERLNPQTGEPAKARKTGGGKTLYAMHYALYYIPKVVGYWITSLCAMFMLVGLITGIVIHKKIFKDFFTFRPGKKQRSWLDMHNVLSVLPLPFHLMITYSGLVLLMFTTMQGVITASYGTDEENRERIYDAVFQQAEHPEERDVLASSISMNSLLIDIEEHWGSNQIAHIGIEGRGTEGAHIEVGRQGYSGLSGGASLMYHGVSGELLHDSTQPDTQALASKQFYDVLYNLHEGLFAGFTLRWLYFLSGLMGAGMVATGMILWAAKRREKAQTKGFYSKGLVLVERLNVGTAAGLPIAIAVYFWANRLIPAGLEGRENWEINSLFIAWTVMLLSPSLFARKYSLSQLWIVQLSLAAALYALLPLLNVLTTDKHLGVTLLQGDWVRAGFDLSMWGFALCFGVAAYKIWFMNKRRQHEVNTSSRSLPKVDTAQAITPIEVAGV
jgi:uncharacterized iron-regulated membrane protein